MNEADHISPLLVRSWLRDGASTDETRNAIRHLLSQCPVCAAEISQLLQKWVDYDWALDRSYSAVCMALLRE